METNMVRVYKLRLTDEQIDCVASAMRSVWCAATAMHQSVSGAMGPHEREIGARRIEVIESVVKQLKELGVYRDDEAEKDRNIAFFAAWMADMMRLKE